MSSQRILSIARINATPTPTTGDTWLSDDHGARGTGRLVLRISANGVRRFYVRFRRIKGVPTRTMSLGRYSRVVTPGFFTLQQARDAANRLFAEQVTDRTGSGSGVSPQKGQSAAAACGVKEVTLWDICSAYLDNLFKLKKSSAREVKNLFERFVKPSAVGGLAAANITPEQFTDFLREEVLEQSSGLQAKKLRVYLRAAYEQTLTASTDPTAPKALTKSGVKVNPLSAVAPMSKFNKARERKLTRKELEQLWRRLQPAHSVQDSIQRRLVRVDLLLGGQRCKQLLRVTLADIDLEAGTVDLRDPKGKREQPRLHQLPILPRAREEIVWLTARAKEMGSPFLFASSVAGKVLNSTSPSKVVRMISQELLREGISTTGFQYIDLRRTIETYLSSVKVPADHMAELQSHGLGGIQKMHYNKHDYMKEKREALRKWHKYLNSLLPVAG